MSVRLEQCGDEARRSEHAAERADMELMVGTWLVENRRLAAPLTGSTEATRFTTVHAFRPLPGGLGYVDLVESEQADAETILYLFDRSRLRWTMHSATQRGLEPPLDGEPTRGGVAFRGERILGGRPVTLRYTWSRTASKSPFCTRAFSEDGGTSWTTDWTMTFLRVDWPD